MRPNIQLRCLGKATLGYCGIKFDKTGFVKYCFVIINNKNNYSDGCLLHNKTYCSILFNLIICKQSQLFCISKLNVDDVIVDRFTATTGVI